MMTRDRPLAEDVGVGERIGDAADPQVFVALYHRYLDPIYKYCARRLPTAEDAEDATSLVFAKALADLPRQRDAAGLRSWLFAIAHNVVADYFRTRRHTLILAAAEGVAEAARAEAHSLDTDELHSLLAQLSADQARILELRLAGLTGPEIARVLGKSHSAVKVAQFRAYARLRQLFDQSGGTTEVYDDGR